jgi:hypothetical protein
MIADSALPCRDSMLPNMSDGDSDVPDTSGAVHLI